MDDLIGDALAAGAGLTHGERDRLAAVWPSGAAIERFRQKVAAMLRELPEDLTVAQLRDALDG